MSMETHAIPSLTSTLIAVAESDANDILRLAEALKGHMRLREGNATIGIKPDEYLKQLEALNASVASKAPETKKRKR